MKANLIEATPEAIVDSLGALRAKKAVLDAQIKDAESLLKDIVGTNVAVDGTKYRVTINTCEVSTVAWKKIAEKLNATKQMIAGNTKKAERTTVKVVALNK